MRRVAACAVSLSIAALGLSGCASDNKPAPVTVTMPATTVTSAPTSSAYASAEASGSSSAAPTPAGDAAIRSIVVEVSSSEKVGPDLLQLNSSGNAYLRLSVRSRGQDGDLNSSDCAMIVDVTGPGNYDERVRKNDCTADFGSWATIKTPGQYTVKVSVTPPGAPSPTTFTKSFRVIGAGE